MTITYGHYYKKNQYQSHQKYFFLSKTTYKCLFKMYLLYGIKCEKNGDYPYLICKHYKTHQIAHDKRNWLPCPHTWQLGLQIDCQKCRQSSLYCCIYEELKWNTKSMKKKPEPEPCFVIFFFFLRGRTLRIIL